MYGVWVEVWSRGVGVVAGWMCGSWVGYCNGPGRSVEQGEVCEHRDVNHRSLLRWLF